MATTIVRHFKRLGSRDFHDLVIIIFVSYQKIMNTAKHIFSRFLKPYSLDDFHKYKMSMRPYNEKKQLNKPVAQFWGCHDLHTADGESVLKRTAIALVVYSTQTGIRINRGHYMKRSHPFRNTLLLKFWIAQM